MSQIGLATGEEIRTAANDREREDAIKMGIAAPTKDFSNPLFCDPKAGALPGCATPRLLGTLKNVSGFVLGHSLASTYGNKYASAILFPATLSETLLSIPLH